MNTPSSWEEWWAQLDADIIIGRIIIAHDDGVTRHLTQSERTLVMNITREAWYKSAAAYTSKREERVAAAAERIANALEAGNEIATRAAQQRGSMDPTLKAMADAAQEILRQPPRTPAVFIMSDPEVSMCPLTGEPCTENCGVGNRCKNAPVGRPS